MSRQNDRTPEQSGKKGGRQKNTPVEPGSAASAPHKKRVTLADIARHAGVSTTAVSFTLSERLDMLLAEATRKRIKQSAKELGYVTNRLSEGFFHGRSKLIGILILAESYQPFLTCIAGIHEALAQADCFPLLMSTDWMGGYRSSRFSAAQEHDKLADLHRLLEYQVDGILYFSLSAHLPHAAACTKDLARRKIPLVMLGGVDPSGGGVDTVGGDNEKTGWMVAEHLLSVNCISFLFVKPARFHPLDDAIHASFAARLKAAGHVCRELTVDTEEPGDLGAGLSRLTRPPTGIFCTRDDIAALMLRTALTLGWRVPHDAAVVAMGQAQIALPRFNTVPITTVERHSFAAGKTAVKLLLRRIEGFSGRPQCILVPPSLETRASSISDVSLQLRFPPSSPHPSQRNAVKAF